MVDVPTWNSLQIIGSNLVGSFNGVRGVSRYQLFTQAPSVNVDTPLFDWVPTLFNIPLNFSNNAELLFNGGFETGDLSGWEDSEAVVVINGNSYSGSFALQITGSGQLSGNSATRRSRGLPNDKIYVLPSSSYPISLWFYSPTFGAGDEIAVQVEYWSNADAVNPIDSDTIIDIIGPDSSWTEYTATINTPTGCDYILLYAEIIASGTVEAYLDDISIKGQSPIFLPLIMRYGLRAIDDDGNKSEFSTFLQPSISPQAIGDPTGTHLRQTYNAVDGGTIETSNFVAGVSGWRLDKDGIHNP